MLMRLCCKASTDMYFQGITFGFFEDLPTDDKHHLEDILYGSKAHSVKIEVSL